MRLSYDLQPESGEESRRVIKGREFSTTSETNEARRLKTFIRVSVNYLPKFDMRGDTSHPRRIFGTRPLSAPDFICSLNWVFYGCRGAFTALRAWLMSHICLYAPSKGPGGDNLEREANNVSLHIQLSRSRLWIPSPLPNCAVIRAV